MEVRKVEVTRYYACDGEEFDSMDTCLAHEQKERAILDNDILASQNLIMVTKENANMCRLEFRLALCDAHDAAEVGDKITFHEKMVLYYKNKVAYNKIKYDLSSERRRLGQLIDKSYKCFGDRRKKSKEAKAGRRKKSLCWRRENPLDKWVSPRRKEGGGK